MLAFVLALAMQAIAAEPPPERYVLVPAWVQVPTDEEVAAVQPRDDAGAPLAGRAIIRCTVAAEGRLADCTVDRQRPADGGFGKAALALADRFVMRPGDEGATVRVPVTWEAAPAAGEAAAAVQERSP